MFHVACFGSGPLGSKKTSGLSMLDRSVRRSETTPGHSHGERTRPAAVGLAIVYAIFSSTSSSEASAMTLGFSEDHRFSQRPSDAFWARAKRR